MKQYKYGILSTASIVPRFIAALRESGRGSVVAIASRDMDKASAKAEEWEIPKCYGSYEALLEDEEVEVVYVAMINSLHYQYSLKALQAGKHVLCEKPFTLNHEEASHLFQVARERNLFIMEAQKSVFLPVMKDVREMIQTGKLGKVQFCDFTSSCSAVYNEWLHKIEAGGGAMAGSASYSLHLAKYLFGENITSFCGICTRGDSEVDEQCVVNLAIDNRVLFVSKISTNVKAIDRALIFCEDAYVEISEYWKARKAIIHYNNGEEVIIEHPCKYELIYEIQHYHDCLDQKLIESPIMSRSMTVDTIAMLDEIRNNW